MNVGFTGHQSRPGIDWDWVESAISKELTELIKPVSGFTSLAAGADQVFADCILTTGGEIAAVVPFDGYERTMSGRDLDRYLHLLQRAKSVTVLDGAVSHEKSYYSAGLYVVQQSDIMFAVWDGLPSAGLGGTADIVHYATQVGRPIVHFDINQKTVRFMGRPQ